MTSSCDCASANPEPVDRTRICQQFSVADRGHPVGAGDRQERQPRDASPVRRRADAAGDPGARRSGLASYIHASASTASKAKNVIATCRQLIDRHGGEVPAARAALEALPGVGRKTANVVLNTAFGEPTIAVDTHIFRVANRTGLAAGKTPLAVELELLRVVPDEFQHSAHHWLILHGRYVCKARKPDCWRCSLADLCAYAQKSSAPPTPAAP
jgi:endonuclease III